MSAESVSGSLTANLIKTLSSNLFFYVILAVCAIQGLWYAFSMQPGLFDESQHIGFIELYSHHLWPFISSQDPSWASLGEIPRNPNYLFYYLISWPFRFISLITHDYAARVIFMRFIMIGFFIGGLTLFRKLFLQLKTPGLLINTSFLILILIPSIAPLPGAVNYDNIIFFLTPLIILLAVKEMGSATTAARLGTILILGMLGSLINYKFIPVFIAIVLYLAHHIWTKKRQVIREQVTSSYTSLSSIAKGGLIVSLLLLTVLFIERPVINVFKYHSLEPSCTKVISEQECLHNYTAKRDVDFLAAKPPDFQRVDIFNYTLVAFIAGMIKTQSNIVPGAKSLPIIKAVEYIIAFTGFVLILIYARELIKNKPYQLLLFITGFYTLALLINDYRSYVALGQPVAISSRYLLPVLPFLELFSLLALWQLIGRKTERTFLIIFAIICLMLTQGGGIMTLELTAGSNYYWRNNVVIEANRKIDTVFRTVVIEQDIPLL